MTDTTSMSARDSIAGSASLFAELLDGRQEEAVPPQNDTIDNLTTIVNEEVSDQFSQVQKASTDRLGLDTEKQLTDYTMLGAKIPDGLKMALTTCLLQSHKINATTTVDTDKLDHTTKLYSKIPDVHKVLLNEMFKQVEAHLQMQVETEVSKIAQNATTLIEGMAPAVTASRRESIRASVSKAMDNKLLTATAPKEAAAGVNKIAEQDRLLKERVKQLHTIDKRVRESSRRIDAEYQNLKAAKDTRNKLPADHHMKQDLTAEEKINNIIAIEKSDRDTSIELRNTSATKMLGIATRVVRQRNDNKGWKSDELKAIEKMKLWEEGDVSTKDTTKALKHSLANWATINIDETWAISPFIARLCESGVGGWTVPCDQILRDKTGELRVQDKTKTPAENMLAAWESVGFTTEDPSAEEIARYKAENSVLHADKLQDDVVIEQLIIQDLEVATGTFRSQSVAAYKEMYTHLGKMMQLMQLERGSPLGDPSEERHNQAMEWDFITFPEAWFLQTETFGEFAKEHARAALMTAVGCFMDQDFDHGTRLVLQAIDDAAELGVEVTWYQTIWKILGVMKLTRNTIWGLLYRDFGHAPTDKSIDCLGDFRTFTTKYRRLMQEGTAADKDLRADGQLGKLVAHYARTSKANYHEIEQRLKGNRTNDSTGGNVNERNQGKSYQLDGNTFKVDSAQAVVTDEETATSQTKFSGRHTFNWASSENRKRFYSQIDGDGKQLCDVKNCTKVLSNARFKSAKDLQRSNDEKYADGDHWTKEKPFGPYKWATCADCYANALAGANNGFITYRDGFKAKMKGNKRQRRAAAARLSKEPEPEPEVEQQAEQAEQDTAGSKRPASTEDQLKLQKMKVELLEAEQAEMKLQAENAKLKRQAQQNGEDGYGTESSRSSSSGSSRKIRGRGSHTAGQRAIADRDSESEDE